MNNQQRRIHTKYIMRAIINCYLRWCLSTRLKVINAACASYTSFAFKIIIGILIVIIL